MQNDRQQYYFKKFIEDSSPVQSKEFHKEIHTRWRIECYNAESVAEYGELAMKEALETDFEITPEMGAAMAKHYGFDCFDITKMIEGVTSFSVEGSE